MSGVYFTCYKNNRRCRLLFYSVEYSLIVSKNDINFIFLRIHMIKEKHNLYIKIPPINRFFVDTLATFNVHGFVSPKEIKQKVALESMTYVYKLSCMYTKPTTFCLFHNTSSSTIMSSLLIVC